MTIAGTYECATASPMGELKSQFVVVPSADGRSFTGSNTLPMGELEVEDGKIDGDKLTWKMNMTVPVPLELTCVATITGDELQGTVSAPSYGDMAMTGKRVG